MYKFNYFLRKLSAMEHYHEPLDIIISNQFLLASVGTAITDLDRQVSKLRIKDGGIGVPILVEKATTELDSSKIITASLLVAVIITQEDSIPAKESTKQVCNERIQQICEMQKQHHKLVEKQLDDDSKLALK